MDETDITRYYHCSSMDDIVGDFNRLLYYIKELEERIERLEGDDDAKG